MRITQLIDEGVLSRLPNNRFDLDASCTAYLRWLRDPARRIARRQVDADCVAATTALIAIRVREKKGELIEREYARSVGDKAIATVLTAMAGMAARIGGSDLQLLRKVDQIVCETPVQLAGILNELGDEAGEPPLHAATTDTDG